MIRLEAESHSTSTGPTSTEHDFRFPRRPVENAPTEPEPVPAAMTRSKIDAVEGRNQLTAQVWRMFVQIKQNSRNQERMENRICRMMHMKLRKQRQKEDARLVY
jgi:hypothetical protein